MSVTFHAEVGEVTGYTVSCWCETNRRDLPGGTYQEALSELDLLRASMVECDCFGDDLQIHPCTDGEGPELNVTATHAAVLLSAVFVQPGPDGEVCGQVDADELLARIGEANPYAATDPGYVIERLPDLAKVAEHAAGLGRKVVWA